MKITGFTIIRNAIKFDYPIVESIQSILPICDEFIVSVGNSIDDTLQLIKSINSPKIKIIESTWDDNLREGGEMLSIETNKCMDAISLDSDWLFYLQADEVIHEKYLPAIKKAAEQFLNDRRVEGLLFNYIHFYGNYNYVADSRSWYREEVRIIRNDRQIRSYKDAQGFRKNGRKLNVKPINAFVYHYGWVKHPKNMQAKQQEFHKLWHDDKWVEKNILPADEFDYSIVDSIKEFKETHPAVMQQRIASRNWNLTLDTSKLKMSFKDRLLYFLEKQTGLRVGEYRNYKII
jgi:hypothetical protein